MLTHILLEPSKCQSLICLCYHDNIMFVLSECLYWFGWTITVFETAGLDVHVLLFPTCHVCMNRTGCLNVSWSSSRSSAWTTTSSWLQLLLVGPRRYARLSQATSRWCVWLGTASASRRRRFTPETPWLVTTSSPTVAPISRGVTFVENSSGVFPSKACAVAVSIAEFCRKPLVLKVLPNTSIRLRFFS